MQAKQGEKRSVESGVVGGNCLLGIVRCGVRFIVSRVLIVVLTLLITNMAGNSKNNCSADEGVWCWISSQKKSYKAGEPFVIDVWVENKSDKPINVAVHGFSWDKLAEWDERAEMEKQIATGNAGGGVKEAPTRWRKTRASVLARGGVRPLGSFQATDAESRQEYDADLLSLWCGTGVQNALMPPGAIACHGYLIDNRRYPCLDKPGTFEFAFTVVAMDGEGYVPITMSNSLRIRILASQVSVPELKERSK